MNRIRFLVNAKVETLSKDGEISEILVPSGSYREVTKVDQYDDDYCDLHLTNGSVLYGIGLQFIEFHGVKPNMLKREKEKEEDFEEKLTKASPAPFLPPAKSYSLNFEDDLNG